VFIKYRGKHTHSVLDNFLKLLALQLKQSKDVASEQVWQVGWHTIVFHSL